MSTQKNLITLCIATVFTLGLAACGGGGGDAPVTGTIDTNGIPPTTIVGQTVPSGTMIPLPEGVELPNLTVTAVMGQTIPVEDIGTFTCASAEGCTVEVVDNVITTTGEIVVDSVADDSVDALLYAALNTEPVELNELQTAQAAAADAATAAMTAAGNAMTAATAATEAGENLATMQTGETSSSLATKASEQAALAHAAYMAAKTASEAAEAATDVTAAVRAQVDAENALADATAAETMAGEYSQMAMDATGNELMIEGTVKTVGGTSLDATAGSTTGTSDGQTTTTGLIASMNPDTTVDMVGGVEYLLDSADADGNQTRAHVQAVAARMFDIGKVVDSPDDMARLMIVTQYAGTKSVKVYASAVGDDLVGRLGSDGRIQTAGVGAENADEPDRFVTLKSVGTYYLAGDDDGLAAEDVVGSETKGTQVFSFVDDNATPDNALDDPAGYVVLGPTTTAADGTATPTYERVEIMVAAATADDVNATMQVTAAIPEATDYKHIHFGVWAALGAAAKNGSQKLSDLGIGFVQNFSGEGLTSIGGGSDDMPNGGGATYNGNWVAAVQAADGDGNGPISLTNGDASLSANFGMGKITATLTDLATLEGAIAGNMFSGTKATVGTNGNSLTATSDTVAFTGSFSGGFYGAAAAEAGGVFDFTSKDLKAGAFRGAFGADKN